MFKFLNSIKNKSTKLIILGSIVFLMYLSMSIVTSLATYPTQAHRTVAAELWQLGDNPFAEDYAKVLESKEYKTLEATTEAKYMLVASAIGTITGFLFTVIMTVFLYGYLRKYRVVKRVIGTIVVITIISSILTFFALTYFETAYVGYALPNLVNSLLVVAFLLTFGVLMQYVITRIVQWNYNRKHSFIVE